MNPEPAGTGRGSPGEEGLTVSSRAGNAFAGVDIVEIERVQRTIDRFGQRFLSRVYTEAEQAYCRGLAHHLAGRFAAKEAVSKALGTGIRRIHWRNIEILRNRAGAPQVTLYGRAKLRFEQLGLTGLEVSISHSRGNALAVVVAMQGGKERK